MKARGRLLRGAKKQQGFAAIEMIVVLILVISALGIGAQAMFDHADNMAAQTTADHQKIISDAAAAYIKDNYAAVVAAAGPATPATITTTMLKNTGYLETSVADLNSFGQAYRVLAIEPTPNKLQTLVVTTGGETISETSIRRIAKQVGARGGYVSNVDTARVEGSFGGWGVPLASYGVSPGAGHLATALFFDDGALTNDYLYRNSVAGHPEVNRMNTSIDMGGNNLNNTGTVNATTANITGNAAVAGNATVGGTIKGQTADITGETYTGGWFRTRGDSGWYNEKWVGGWYMSDPTWVRSYANKNVYTAGEMRGGKLTSEGRTEVGEYLQLNGVATEGAGCSPNGLVGRNAAGLTLSCQSGVWKGGNGSAGTLATLCAMCYARFDGINNTGSILMITAYYGKVVLNNNYNEDQNVYELSGYVGGTRVVNSLNANRAYSKSTSITFFVPAGSAYSITSNPPNQSSGPGRFYAYAVY
ncbi:shufflon system plasmid conjugative transfer pilus tip adhesin PilV [Pseudomonas aeruginosa]|uniref:shufflon system plasmid conjugative transfer pilus tip adhesin PilV n=2 Tax=Pseudomonas aeruginosa TaxID=287 RepID=UPI0022B6B32F|nr:shufflon system plasmid conjugative transfer pilus tip adhesin PilV [Pseudomonas aeruginosa]MCZ7830996.1 shufflon system plasmid conjugative transfer pilus tip adhesin PilV [Pseudomonas aeruginosa]